MSRVKTRNTNHSYKRAYERCGWDKETAKVMMKNASKYGITPFQLPQSDRQLDLILKQFKTNRRIKIYKGYVFIFASTSTRCYTIYPLESEKE